MGGDPPAQAPLAIAGHGAELIQRNRDMAIVGLRLPVAAAVVEESNDVAPRDAAALNSGAVRANTDELDTTLFMPLAPSAKTTASTSSMTSFSPVFRLPGVNSPLLSHLL